MVCLECVACDAGRVPSDSNGECGVCPPGQFSTDGVSCGYCPVGQEPNVMEFSVGATHCLECINGTHQHNDGHPELGVMASCASCSPGQRMMRPCSARAD